MWSPPSEAQVCLRLPRNAAAIAARTPATPPTSRDSSTARVTWPASGVRPSPSTGRSSTPCAVSGAAAEPDLQRARERGLDLARVRAGMRGRVAAPGAPRAGRRPADDRRAGVASSAASRAGTRFMTSSMTRRRPAELAVARGTVADHGVQRVDRAVAEQAGHAGDGTPEQRRDDRVGGVLGDGFDGRARQAGLVEGLRVAAAQAGQPVARGGDVAGVEFARRSRCPVRPVTRRRARPRWPAPRWTASGAPGGACPTARRPGRARPRRR